MTYYISDRITVNPEQCGGRPCIRGMRIRVVDVLELVATNLNIDDVLNELPDLEAADVIAALKFAASRVDHPVIHKPIVDCPSSAVGVERP